VISSASLLQLDGVFDGVHGAGEFDEDAIA
jgi:hypothetical protein